MRYTDDQFNSALLKKIKLIEEEMEKYEEVLLSEYSDIFKEKNLHLSVKFEREGDEKYCMVPGYRTTFSIELSDCHGGVIELDILTIWDCEYIFFGMPIKRYLLGCEVEGELFYETLDEIKEQINDCMKDMLEYIKE